ncbi:MAG: autotransporter outer membrane beta-barrel domain-containing protein [Pseudomonadota bacterium]
MLGVGLSNRKERRREAALRRKSCRISKRVSVPKSVVNTVAAGAVTLAAGLTIDPNAARAQNAPNPVGVNDPQCLVAGSTVTCTGDLQPGVFVAAPPFDTLIVENLNAGILSQFDGVAFLSKGDGDVNVTVDSGAFGIQADTDGIFARTDNGNISILNTGDITAGNEGIGAEVDRNGDITVNNTGNINSDYGGIYAEIEGVGNIDIDQTGDINTAGTGVYAVINGEDDFKEEKFITANDPEPRIERSGDININVTGNIMVDDRQGDFYGIDAFNNIGNIVIDVTGNIVVLPQQQAANPGLGFHQHAEGVGIQAYARRGDVSVNLDGNVTAQDAAIRASANGYGIPGAGNVNITVTGDVESRNETGITAYASNNINVDVGGTINTDEVGIAVITQYGNVAINTEGNITSRYNSGIIVGLYNYQGIGRAANLVGGADGPNPFIENTVSIKNGGNISTGLNGSGIAVTGFAGFGDRGPQAANGLFVENTVLIENSGDIMSGDDGIFVGTQAANFVGKVLTVPTLENMAGPPGAVFAPGLFDANNVTISNSGDINAGGNGIFVGTSIINDYDGGIRKDNLAYNHMGDRQLPASGVFFDSSVNITNTGDILADDNGIFVGVENVNAYGNIQQKNLTNFPRNAPIPYASAGTFAQNDINIQNRADITTGFGSGIFVGVQNGNSFNPFVFNNFAGGLVPLGVGSSIFGENEVTIGNTGDIATENGNGIFVGIENGGNLINAGLQMGKVYPVAGNPRGSAPGIMGGNVINIANLGDITVRDGSGIFVGIDGQRRPAVPVTGRFENAIPVGMPLPVPAGGGYDIFGNNEVSIINTGDITVTSGSGIAVGTRGSNLPPAPRVMNNAPANGGPVFNPGLFNGNDVSIINTGDIAVTNGNGIFVGLYGYTGINPVIAADSPDVNAKAPVTYSGNEVEITNFGNISSTTGAGILVGRDQRGLIARANMVDGGLPDSSTTITNAGRISGGNGFSIDLRGDGNDVVNLLAGTTLDGAIDFGNGNDGMGGFNPNDIDTLNIGPGVNAVINFADSSRRDSDLESAPEIINVAGASAVLNNGMTVVAVDTTNESGQAPSIAGFTDALFNALDFGGSAQGSFGPQGSFGFGAVGENGEVSDGGRRLWGSVFGGYQDFEANGNLVGFEHSFFGLASGVEIGDAELDGVFGLLGGYGDSSISADFNAGSTDIDTFFGGVYWKRDYGSHRVHAAFVAGATDNETSRQVGGMTASGEFDGVFYAPSVTVAVPLDAFETPMYASARANYVHLDLDGYTETGIALPLTVPDRDVSIFNVRAQLNLPQTTEQSSGTVTNVNWFAGVDGTFDAGTEEVTAIVGGAPLAFEASTRDDVGGFVGLNIDHTSADGMKTFGFNGEFLSTVDGTVEVLGELTATFDF